MIGPDANPAAIIYEVLNNATWGIGCPSALIDFDTFAAASQVLSEEELGLSLTWSNQASAEEFINIILDHIDGFLFVHPRTGRHTLRLARDDYDPEELREITPDNGRMISFQFRAWGETTNEMQVTWTNPENEQDENVTLQDLGNIIQQGEVVSASKNYFGVRNADLAMTLCARELRKAASPAVSAEMQLLREAWDLVPGDVVKLSWPDYGITSVIMRVAEVDYGEPGNAYIQVKMSEDIFSMARAQFVSPPSTEWVDPTRDPEPLTEVDVLTLPAYLLAVFAGVDMAEVEYPTVVAGILAANDSPDTFGFNLLERVPDATGELHWLDQGRRLSLGVSTLTAPLEAEPGSVIEEFGPIYGESIPAEAILALVGDGPVDEREFVLIHTVDGSGYHVHRGVLDTVPKEWPAGARVWFIPPEDDVNILDETENSAGATVEYKLLSVTSRGTLAEDDAPTEVAVMSERPHLPSRPADVRVNGVGFGTAEVEFDDTEIAVTWANRNRLSENAIVLPWTSGTVTPETGQTTTVTVLDPAGNPVTAHDGLSGTSFALPVASLNGLYEAQVLVTSERDGLESLQGHEVAVEVLPPPYPVVWAYSDTQFSTSSSQARTIPGATKPGDMLIGCLMHRSAATVPTGWALLNEVGPFEANAGSPTWVSVFVRTAEAGDAGSPVSFEQAASDRMASHVLLIRSSEPLEVVAVETFAQSLDAQHITVAVAEATGADQLAITVGATVLQQNSASAELNPPAGWTGTTPVTTGSTAHQPRMGVAWQRINAPGETAGEFVFRDTYSPTDNGVGSITLIIGV